MSVALGARGFRCRRHSGRLRATVCLEAAGNGSLRDAEVTDAVPLGLPRLRAGGDEWQEVQGKRGKKGWQRRLRRDRQGEPLCSSAGLPLAQPGDPAATSLML